MTDSSNKENRSSSEILISLEEKINLLIKVISASDMNSKLMLDRLNKLVKAAGQEPTALVSNAVVPSLPAIEMQMEPVQTKRNQPAKKKDLTGKIPVGQKVSDSTGKDFFNAEVLITNLSDGEITKTKTNAIGKWQTYLGPGNYKINISKKTDPTSANKLEFLQEINISSELKSLQLSPIVIKR